MMPFNYVIALSTFGMRLVFFDMQAFSRSRATSAGETHQVHR